MVTVPAVDANCRVEAEGAVSGTGTDRERPTPFWIDGIQFGDDLRSGVQVAVREVPENHTAVGRRARR